MEKLLDSNKLYLRYKILSDPSIFDGKFLNYEVSDGILTKLAKDLGFSYEFYLRVKHINHEASKDIVRALCEERKIEEILLLVDEKNSAVIGYSLDIERYLLLNSEFYNTVSRLEGTSDALKMEEVYYMQSDIISSIILKKVAPILIEEKYEGKESKFTEYNIGILLVNNELEGAHTRLVLYLEGEPLYLPASFYNTSISRYKKSTGSAIEALEILILRVIEDLREDTLAEKLKNLHYIYRANKNILATYEEYHTLIRTMRKIPTIIEEPSYLDNLLHEYEDFEKKYSSCNKSSYIWRCTALSDDLTVGKLVAKTAKLLNELYASPEEYASIRELLGIYISTNRIASEIAPR